jgi:hypothetical protein
MKLFLSIYCFLNLIDLNNPYDYMILFCSFIIYLKQKIIYIIFKQIIY